jgi:hypothetical protein
MSRTYVTGVPGQALKCGKVAGGPPGLVRADLLCVGKRGQQGYCRDRTSHSNQSNPTAPTHWDLLL